MADALMTPEAATAKQLSEFDVFALTVHFEARGEGLVGMLAVGFVLLNRRSWGQWGATVREVCLARKQFSCWSPDGGGMNHVQLWGHATMIRRGIRPPSMQLAYEVAEALLVFGRIQDFTDSADHFYSPKSMQPPGSKPSWIYPYGDRTQPELSPVFVYGGHRFYRLRSTR